MVNFFAPRPLSLSIQGRPAWLVVPDNSPLFLRLEQRDAGTWLCVEGCDLDPIGPLDNPTQVAAVLAKLLPPRGPEWRQIRLVSMLLMAIGLFAIVVMLLTHWKDIAHQGGWALVGPHRAEITDNCGDPHPSSYTPQPSPATLLTPPATPLTKFATPPPVSDPAQLQALIDRAVSLALANENARNNASPPNGYGAPTPTTVAPSKTVAPLPGQAATAWRRTPAGGTP